MFCRDSKGCYEFNPHSRHKEDIVLSWSFSQSSTSLSPFKDMFIHHRLELRMFDDGERIGGMSVASVDNGLYVVRSAAIRHELILMGYGQAMYLEMAKYTPGLIIPDQDHSEFAEMLWSALQRKGHTVLVEFKQRLIPALYYREMK